MKNYFFSILFIVSSFVAFSQSSENDSVVTPTVLTSKNMYSYQNNGWELMEYAERKFLLNLSNKEYVLLFRITCKQEGKKPNFLIEYSNNYRDGNYGRIDFTNSRDERFEKTVILIDEVETANPFEKSDEKGLQEFINLLKKGKTLTFQFYDLEYNPETEKEELELNRALNFKLENSELLDHAVDCE